MHYGADDIRGHCEPDLTSSLEYKQMTDNLIFVIDGTFAAIGVVAVLAGITLSVKRIFFQRMPDFSVFAAAAGVLGVVLGLLDIFVVSSFEQVYRGFLCTDLPKSTRLVLDFRHFLWVPLFVVGISFILWCALQSAARRKHGFLGKKMLLFYLSSFLGEVMLLLWAIRALYAGIFDCGQAV